MIHSRRWTVEIVIDEHGDEWRTHAQARLHTQDRSDLRGDGTARRSPRDADVPEIGDDVAVARALADLARQLMETAGNGGGGVPHGQEAAGAVGGRRRGRIG
jgi:Rv2632c-like